MILFFDTETTGIPRRRVAPACDVANWPRAVQIGWLVCDAAGREQEAEEWIVAPDGYTIPPSASRIHGITTERAKAEGVPVTSVLRRLAAAVQRVNCVVAHNLSFDAGVVGAEFCRLGWDNPLDDLPQFCTMLMGTRICQLPGPYGFKWPTLGELYRHLFGILPLEAHQALADVRACAACYFEMCRRYGCPRGAMAAD